MKYKPYPKYVDSGVEWLGEIPEGWAVAALKRFYILQDRPVREEDEIVTAFRDGTVTLRRNRREDGFTNALLEIGYQGVRKGDLVIHAMDAFAGAIGVSDSDGKSTPVYSVCRTRNNLCTFPQFHGYFLRSIAISGYIAALAKGIRERSTDFRWAEAGKTLVLLPPLPTQKAIVSFLDAETARIDGLVKDYEDLIALLQEKRQALISHSVTRGLSELVSPNDPEFGQWAKPVKFVDTEIEYIRKVPEHWEVLQLRRVVEKFEQGWSPECETRPAENGEWGVLKSGCVNGGIFMALESKALPESLSPREQLEVRDGDVLMSRANGSPKLIGSVAYVQNPQPRLMISDKIFRLSLSSNIAPTFFVRLMSAFVLRTQIELSIGGADGLANNLPQSSIKEYWIIVPPLNMQLAITAFLDKQTSKLDALVSEAESAIALLKERRSALITAAVTGKINVEAVGTPGS